MNGIADDGEIRQSEGEHDELDEDGDEDSDEELESAQSAGGENEEDEDENEDEDEEDDESEDESATQSAKVRELMQDSRSLTTSLAAAHQTDLSKAAAIKMQRKTFDALLNTRIKLQKALVSINSVAVDAYREETAPDASEAAEASALRLLSNLTDLRASLDEARTGQKRKRTSFISSTPPSEIWESIRASESRALPHRKAILERWSAKTRGASLASAKGRLNAGAQQSLTDVLSSQISNSQRLVERTTVPRSCAPQQLAAGSASDLNIYDDGTCLDAAFKVALVVALCPLLPCHPTNTSQRISTAFSSRSCSKIAHLISQATGRRLSWKRPGGRQRPRETWIPRRVKVVSCATRLTRNWRTSWPQRTGDFGVTVNERNCSQACLVNDSGSASMTRSRASRKMELMPKRTV